MEESLARLYRTIALPSSLSAASGKSSRHGRKRRFRASPLSYGRGCGRVADLSWREGFYNDSLLLDEPAEEAVLFPLRAVICVGDTQRQIFEDCIELRSGREVDGLAQVI